MGSVGNNPWAPYNTYKDCSQEICSIYCPQYCYLIFPPPSSDDNHGPFSPLIIAIISVLATAILLVMYYTLVIRFRRRQRRQNVDVLAEEDREELGLPCPVGSAGLDEAVIKAIMVRKYNKEERMVEGSECVVCINEFQEGEFLRILPKCGHAFHVPCIDTWLVSHSVCPLCRANVVALAHPSPQSPPQPRHSHVDDVILTVDDGRPESVEIVEEAVETTTGNEELGSAQREVKSLMRSTSYGVLSSCPHQVSSSDMVDMEENGDSKQLAMKRSLSTGRLLLKDCNNQGKKSILPY